MELTNYNGVKILVPEPTGEGGKAIQDNFKTLVNNKADLSYVDNADTALWNRIYGEEATRGQNDANLQAQIAAKADVSYVNSGLATVSSNLSVEQLARQRVDSTLTDNINGKADSVHAHTPTQITGLLGGDGKISLNYIPSTAITNVYVCASLEQQDALTVQTGDVVLRTDENANYIYDGQQWQQLLTPPDLVQSVNGYVGAVNLVYSDVGADPEGAAAQAEENVGYAIGGLTTALNQESSDRSNADNSLSSSIGSVAGSLASHENNTGNPHSVTLAQVGGAAASHTHGIADVTNLQTGLDAKAPLASPTFTGTISTPRGTFSGGTTNTCTITATASSGTTDIQQWKNASGTVVGSISYAGTATFSQFTAPRFTTNTLDSASGGTATLTLQGSVRGMSAAGTSITMVNNTISNASGQFNGVAITPTFNQSGTAAYTALLVNVTETATGSGSKALIDAQVGGTSKFSVDNTGVVAAKGYKSSDGSAGATGSFTSADGKTVTVRNGLITSIA